MAYNAAGLGFSTIGLEGVNLTLTQTVVGGAISAGANFEFPNPTFSLGQVCRAVDDSEYVFVKHAQATTLGQVGYLDTSWNFTTITSTNAAPLTGQYVAVNSQASTVASGDYGWVQVKGGCPVINVAASTLANAPLYTSAVAGQLTSTSGGMPISGIFLTTANGGVAGNQPGTMDYPLIGGGGVFGSTSLAPVQFTTAALAGPQTLTAGAITGSVLNVLQNTGAAPGTQTTRTAAQMLADVPGAQVGLTTEFRIVNTGAGTLTLAGGTGVTINGTATVATNVFRDYTLTFNTATTATIQSVGSGTSP